MNAQINSTEDEVTILIVEDSPTQAEHLKYLLEQHSYNVTVANNGRQALSHIGKHIPTLLITDIVMPEMSGYELCRKIKAEANTKDIPVILLTSLSNTEDVLEGLACGADNFISKPYSEQYLLSNIANILVNVKLRKSEYVRLGMEIQFGGKRRFITADQQQMFSMLISTYEAAVNRNKELIKAQDDLKAMNERLEELVDERTTALMTEVAGHKQAEEASKESEKKYRMLADNVNDVIFILDMNMNYTYVSPSIKLLNGYEPTEVLERIALETLTSSSKDLAMRTISEIMELEKSGHREIPISRTVQLEIMRKDGTTVWTEVKVSFVRDEYQRPVGILGLARDITVRKQNEETLRVSEENYRNLFENAGEAIYVIQDGKLAFINPIATMMIGYPAEELASRSFIEFLHPDDRDMVIKRHARRMKGEELSRIYPFRIIHRDGHVIWVELNAVLINWQGKPATLNFLSDITERKRAEEKLKQTLDSLKKSFGTTIQVLVSAAEARDPYTAGHQLRSAKLACAIAAELGLAQEIIDGIRMAGSIHDIGKLSIPSEILTKPTKLTRIEFSLIQEHSRKGYEMVKDVESPWPLAQIIYQHHERMDGTGYPRNLKGDEILMEARIMAVADVVEAMASHRPYRPALGIEAALTEIEKNKGTLYDHYVADACLRLFREKSYKLPV